MRLATPLVPVLALAACVESPPPIEPQVTSRVERMELPVSIPRPLDVLFVIDSSPAMAAHRARLDTTVPALIAELEARLHGVPDLHLGVVTADVGGDGCTGPGDAGRLRGGASVAGAFLSDRPSGIGTRERNYTGELVNVVRELADVGTAGCAIARPLEALRLALANPENGGFRRDDAVLVIVFVTANDDASPAPLADYVTAARSTVVDSSRLILAPLSGGESGSVCGEAPAPRLLQFVDAVRGGYVRASICTDDVSGVVSGLIGFHKDLLGLPCWQTQLLDLDPATPELEPVCEGWLTGPSVHASLPPCPAGPSTAACYRIEPSRACADSGSGHYTLRIDGVFSLPREPMRATVECLVDGAVE